LVEVSAEGRSAAEVSGDVERKTSELIGSLPSGSVVLIKISGGFQLEQGLKLA